MDNIQSIKKWSDVRNMAVVITATGTKVGTVDDFYFHPSTTQIEALKVKTGLFSSRVLPTNAINGIGIDAITTASEDMLIQEKDDAALSRLPLGQTMLSYRVMSESGTIVGTIGNILLDVSTPAKLQLVSFQLAGGLRQRISGRYPTFDAHSVISYGQDVLVIPDTIALELTK